MTVRLRLHVDSLVFRVEHRYRRAPRPGSLALGARVRGRDLWSGASGLWRGVWRVAAVGSEGGVPTVDLV